MIRFVVKGQVLVRLSRRETEVLKLTTEGLSYKEIAYELGIQEGTVKRVVEHLRDGLAFRKSNMLTAWAASRPEVFAREAVSPERFRPPVMRESLPLAS